MMEYKKLSDLTAVVTGGTPSTSVVEYWNNGNIPWLQSGCCQNCDVISAEKYITQLGYDNSSTRMMPPDTVMIALTGATAGKIGYLNFEACGNQSITGILPCELINQRFLFYYLISKRSQILADCVGGAQAHISQGYVKNINFPMYSLENQEKIVAVLDKTSSLLNARKKELQKLDEIVKARFVELFGLPVLNTKGWPTESMEKVAPAVNYKGDFDEEVWLLNLDMVEAQTGRILDYLIVKEDEVGNSTCTFDTSNVLYSKLRPYLNKVVIPERCGYATSEMVPLQPVKTKISREYLAFMLRSDEFVNMINEKVAGAKMPRVSMGDFRKFDVPVPPMDIQEQFTDFVKQIDKSKFV